MKVGEAWMYDCIVIGGGPSGLMASIAAAEKGTKVLLLDKGNKLGRKLGISGGGRCNVTNRMPVNELIQHIPGNGRFLYSAFSMFNNEDIIIFFEKLGITLKEEDHGRMFPATDKAQTVVNALVNRVKELGVEIRTNASVKTVHYHDGRTTGIELKNREVILAKTVIIAVGGKSVPQTGSTGDGYAWVEKAGHTITELYPTEVPITSSESFIQEKVLQGLSLRNVGLSVLNEKGKIIVTHQLDMIFTHFGISGPAALRCSQFVVKELKKSNDRTVTMMIDLFPDKNEEDVVQEITSVLEKEPKKAIKNALKGYIPERYLLFLLGHIGIESDMIYAYLAKEKIRWLAKTIKGFTFKVNGTLSIEQAFVTGGGVSIKEVDPKRMASKKMKGLYFCGEILDVHGYTGGFNITAAFVTGHVAGKSAAEEAIQQP
ncbi:MAG: NAD(P)/FAD-dependent oxidoreductase [Tepidibacillus sp.]